MWDGHRSRATSSFEWNFESAGPGTDPAPWGGRGPIESVQVGMAVVDAAGERIGRVARVVMGDPWAVTTRGNEPAESNTLVGLGRAALGADREPRVPEGKSNSRLE